MFVFLAVAITTVSLTERLKTQTQQAITAQQHAETARRLAEQLLKLSEQQAVLEQGCDAINQALMAQTVIVSIPASPEDEATTLLNTALNNEAQADMSAARWVATHQQVIGSQTGHWVDLPYWCLPLARHDEGQLVIFVYPAQTETFIISNLAFVQGLVDQISLALGLLLAKSREQQAVRLAERESVQHALLASLSHDFRTPLTAIMGAASSLATQSEQLDGQQQQALLNSIVTEAAQLVDDAENILSLTRMETLGQSALHSDWQLPEELIGVVLARCRRRYPSAKLTTAVAPALPLICVDASLIAQALMNLLENALKFDHSGELILLSAQQHDDWLVFSVQDQGEGLIESEMGHLKTKFTRAHSESAQPGFGLGLSICEAVATIHHGRLCLENSPTRGLIASMCFPITPAPTEDNA